jgi:hypothetical protein
MMTIFPAPQKLAVALLLALSWVAQTPLQQTVQAKPAPTTLQFKMPQLPSRGRPIGRYRGGASRGNCPAVNLPLTALVPFTKQPSPTGKGDLVNVWGLTTAPQPTFWFFNPYTNGATHPAEFVLQNGNGDDVYRTQVALPNDPGVLRVSLPAQVSALQPNVPYRWYFRIFCDPQKATPPIYVEGVIQRVTLNDPVANQLAAANLRQKVDLYANNGIWYDALTALAELRRVSPADDRLRADWQSLLRSIGLEGVATAPLVQ